jgi:hypothetical protein
MKKNAIYLMVSALILLSAGCGYKERGHSNTPPEHPGSQVKTGADSIVHPGNIDMDSIHLHDK